jgi:hypothetical protein
MGKIEKFAKGLVDRLVYYEESKKHRKIELIGSPENFVLQTTEIVTKDRNL